MLETIKQYWHKLPIWVTNRYFLLVATFAIVLLFLDSNNVLHLLERKQTLNRLQKQEQMYLNELKVLREQKEAFENDSEALEKFAREEYRMKRDYEDVFVIIEK